MNLSTDFGTRETGSQVTPHGRWQTLIAAAVLCLAALNFGTASGQGHSSNLLDPRITEFCLETHVRVSGEAGSGGGAQSLERSLQRHILGHAAVVGVPVRANCAPDSEFRIILSSEVVRGFGAVAVNNVLQVVATGVAADGWLYLFPVIWEVSYMDVMPSSQDVRISDATLATIVEASMEGLFSAFTTFWPEQRR